MPAITPPHTPAEWAAYYRLRYEVLRQPWQQPEGSEQADDDHAPTTTHALLLAPEGYAAGVGRLHPSGPAQGQVRFMAVHPAWQGRGVGRQVLEYLETAARSQGLREVVLHAREQAVPFYQRLGYAVVAPSHTLFGTIPHLLMRRVL
ncbi:GNAT superfamily N-acetyltransferase [Hymenobacter luteus]|uniref:GNAT superfamily N-acetyltransferase n=2 Tax=Hymenobacter TaxID=89966 RepID=A0A7W9SXR7_9BACT|nr:MULTISPECIES: GNAT family N-acetyltransferase [Hymenobacter]MBB4599818.1 GNAT superfamily N-acetyltransferase [Hymenobacter latericoloratus]MBB6057872.1 GNAT superfamily N-acetyltransferase [Hymenobacter luteus]